MTYLSKRQTMTRLLYSAIVVHILAFALCVIAFITTSDIFQYLLAVFNLIMLFNTVRMSAEMGL